MAKEREGYRAQLSVLAEQFPGPELIPLKAAAEYLGVDPRSLKTSECPVKKIGRMYYVPKTGLARWLS